MNGKGIPSQDTLDKWSIDAQRELAEGSAERACDLIRQLVEVWTRIQGPDGERVLSWRGFLGRALTEARRYQQAEEALSALLSDRARVEGAEATGTLVVRGNLARVIALGGRPMEAIVIAQRLLEDRIRLLGRDDPSTLDTRGNIAHFHYLAGLNLVAVDLYEDLLGDRERVLGLDHPVVTATRTNLAAVRAAATGSASDLEGLLRVAGETLANLGPDHPTTATQYALVAERLEKAGRYEEALGYIDWACDARARLLGERNAMTVSARTLRARCLSGLRRTDEALMDLSALVARLGSMGLAGDQTSLSARADMFELMYGLMCAPYDDHVEALIALWTGMYEDSRGLEPGNPLREWIDEQGELFDEADEAEDDDEADEAEDDEDDEDDDGDYSDDAEEDGESLGAIAFTADLRHYRVAYFGMPMMLFGEFGSAIITGFLRGVGPELMKTIWQQVARDSIEKDQFPVEVRLTASGGCVIAIGMPSTGTPNEAGYLGVYVPVAMKKMLDGHADDDEASEFADGSVAAMGVRLFSIEHAIVGTKIGEIRVDRHMTLGNGPRPSADAMLMVVCNLTGEVLQ
jgi:tetratricopeptide (TPR) repeat protein